MRISRIFATTFFAISASQVSAQQPENKIAEEAASLSVSVRDVRNPEWKPYHTMLLGVAAFEANRQLAPTAKLRFALRPLDNTTNLDNVNLRILSGNASLPIPIGEDGTFELPIITSDETAELLVNRKKDTLSIRPDIRTPNLATNIRRLGDLRLECNVRWAIQKDELSFLQRNAFRLLGGPCKSNSVKTFYIADHRLKSAWLTEGKLKVPLELSRDGAVFRPPLADVGWSDDALVELEFANSAATREEVIPTPTENFSK